MRRPLSRWLASISARLLLVNAFLVVVPIAGISFARTYERELLRGEEEGMVTAATAVAAAGMGDPRAPAVAACARAAAERLRAQVRVLDGAGAVLVDTGPERVELRTQGRRLLSSLDPRSVRRVDVQESLPADAGLAARPEVAKALGGAPGRYTRRMQNVRGVQLFVAEPMRAPDGGPAVRGVVYVARTTYPVLVSLYYVRNALIKIALVSLGVAAVVALFLGFTIARPLRRLTEAAGRIAAGERGVALNLRGSDEVAELARDFDAMARALDARLAYISELAANVSHEFKTPIASMRGAAELLRDGAANDPVARERFLGNILADAERLARLVTRLLELSRVESVPEAREVVDYRSLCAELVGRYRDDGRDVTLVWTAAHEPCRCAPEQVKAALACLVDNALRFSPAGAEVTVRVAGDVHAFHTRVVDRGAGVSAANLARVWDRFFTTARADGGTGLGLSIVRAVVEAHGGTVGVESKPGDGATFWFTLPRRL